MGSIEEMGSDHVFLTEHPNLARLYEKLAQRPSFVASLPPG